MSASHSTRKETTSGSQMNHSPPSVTENGRGNKQETQNQRRQSETTSQKNGRPLSRTRLILESLFLIAGMVMYVADLGTDISVAVQYVLLHKYAWSGLTIAFIIIPSITIQYLSFRWFVVDFRQTPKSNRIPFWVKLKDWVVWVIVHLLQLGVLKRYWRTVKYGWKSQEKPDYYELSVYEYRDITMLRLLESFMEAAPQLVLQLYIMTQQQDIYWLTVVSALVSLSSLSWGIEAYHKALRESCSSKNNLCYAGLFLRLLWRTFTITARVISLALFAAFNIWFFIPLVAVHYVGMSLWLIYQDTDFCTTKLEEILFDAIIGIIHIFCFFNMKEGQTRYRALFFYTVILIENTVMFALWYHHIGWKEVYGLPALVFVWGGFFLGIFIMLFYYRCLHPNRNIRLWGGGSSTQKAKPPKESPDTAHAYSQDVTDAPVPWDDIVLPSKTRGCRGNLFTHEGRRYCYWKDLNGDCPCDTAFPKPQQATIRQPSSSSGIDIDVRGCGCSGTDANCCGQIVSKEHQETLV